ncbi:hypothetical protein [Paenibacillus arenilitoris]|uniref:Uncharacterized protein n=1 Tax=Paenibacillus arenilitoris TaxID=2772299 RepID=A0A927H441_9BACL|nr:hypothetical protein [Paenibacillus arenilitoris]MBD2867515.1 hypothetical protein [Paenibacillus arenilitoris]
MDFPLAYYEWSEPDQRVVRTIVETRVAHDDVFVRKLVNATAFRNGLYEHTANECEDGLRHSVYVKPFGECDDAVYGRAILAALHEYCSVSPYMEAEFLLWNGSRFNPCMLGQRPPAGPLEFARLLLDHYIVSEERSYETIYTIYDLDRSKIVVFLKGVNP